MFFARLSSPLITACFRQELSESDTGRNLDLKWKFDVEGSLCEAVLPCAIMSVPPRIEQRSAVGSNGNCHDRPLKRGLDQLIEPLDPKHLKSESAEQEVVLLKNL